MHVSLRALAIASLALTASACAASTNSASPAPAERYTIEIVNDAFERMDISREAGVALARLEAGQRACIELDASDYLRPLVIKSRTKETIRTERLDLGFSTAWQMRINNQAWMTAQSLVPAAKHCN